MKAEILCVGTELLLGHTLNTHTQFLSQMLAELGISLYYHTTVGDNKDRLTEQLRVAASRSDLILLTGGLGPTTDDLTKETLCEVLNLPCEEDPAILQDIQNHFASTGREMPENNRKQAMIPQGATVLPNDHGTAPGLWVEQEGKTFVLLPGPPKELETMVQNHLIPLLQEKSKTALVSRQIRIFGMGESKVEILLSDLVTSENPTVALYAKTGEVMARVTAAADTKARAQATAEPMVEEICKRLGEVVYGIDTPSLAATVVELLKQKGKTVALAESCTGGMLASQLTDCPGASEVFGFGAVTYANEMKQKQLLVSAETLEKCGAVSEETAREMAEGLFWTSQADFCAAVTGIAGPTGGTPDKPVGTVYVAVKHDQKAQVQRLELGAPGRTRDTIRQLTCLHVWDMVRRMLTDR